MKGKDMKTTALTLVVAALALMVVGCEQRGTDFTIISTRNVDLSRAGTFKRGPVRVRGDDQIPIFIFKFRQDHDLEVAIDEALDKTPGSVALVDGVIKRRQWWFIFGEDTLIIEGTPLIDPQVMDAPDTFE